MATLSSVFIRHLSSSVFIRHQTSLSSVSIRHLWSAKWNKVWIPLFFKTGLIVYPSSWKTGLESEDTSVSLSSVICAPLHRRQGYVGCPSLFGEGLQKFKRNYRYYTYLKSGTNAHQPQNQGRLFKVKAHSAQKQYQWHQALQALFKESFTYHSPWSVDIAHCTL